MMAKIVEHDRSTCNGKKKHSYYSGSRELKNFKRHNREERLNLYRCKSCNMWHIGNVALKGKKGEKYQK